MKYYIAYGSNMSKFEIRKRCPNVEFVKKDILKDYKLEFKSMDNINSYASIYFQKGSNVFVSIYKINKKEEDILDEYEDVENNLYYKKYLEIEINNKKEKALVYIMNDNAIRMKPQKEYLSTLYRGYKEFDFDVKYIKDIIKKIGKN